jgi:hypothetical protein
VTVLANVSEVEFGCFDSAKRFMTVDVAASRLLTCSAKQSELASYAESIHLVNASDRLARRRETRSSLETRELHISANAIEWEAHGFVGNSSPSKFKVDCRTQNLFLRKVLVVLSLTKGKLVSLLFMESRNRTL